MPPTLISVLTAGVGHSCYYFSSQESGTSITKLYLYRILFIRVKSVVDKVFRKRCNTFQSFTLRYLEEHEPWLPDDLPFQFYPDKEEGIYPPLLYYGVAVTTAELYAIADFYKERIFPNGGTSDLALNVSNFFNSIARLGSGRGRVMTHRCWSREGHMVIALLSNYTIKDMYPAGPAHNVAAVVNKVFKCDPPKVPKWYLQETDDMPTRP